jgi:hypothetical protein
MFGINPNESKTDLPLPDPTDLNNVDPKILEDVKNAYHESYAS